MVIMVLIVMTTIKPLRKIIVSIDVSRGQPTCSFDHCALAGSAQEGPGLPAWGIASSPA